MNAKLTLTNLFVYSDKVKQYSFTELDAGLNIFTGLNTSGKSTFFLSVLYALGINDANAQLKDILDLKPFFRLDSELIKNGKVHKLTFIRDEETLFVRYHDQPIKRFNGISANNSNEHIKLKEYLHSLFDFQLYLETSTDYKPASIEVLLLPYYISQRVGWVYLRKSFSSLDFYRNFKTDYLDYYLGIENTTDRLKKKEIERGLKSLNEEIRFLETTEVSNDNLEISKLSNEDYSNRSQEYIQGYADRLKSLTNNENEYVLKCNELSFLTERLSVLKKVSKHHKEQNPETDLCPVCDQHLPSQLSATYKYLQEQNDTNAEILLHRAKIKEIQSSINSLKNKIKSQKVEIENEYRVISRYTNMEHSFETWLNNKANVKLVDNIHKRIGELTLKKNGYLEDLKKFKTEADIQKLRDEKNGEFELLFAKYLLELNVKALTEDRYTKLYDITAFPSDGVELHKTVMAYHFAFNKLIKSTPEIHRLPFMLDAIFKEDLEKKNKETILRFIAKNLPTDTQTIISIAEATNFEKIVDTFNANFFQGKAKVIYIGEGLNERSFLSNYKNQHDDYLEETLDIIENN